MSYQYDHRFLADEMELYFFDEQIGGGLPVWLPNGVIIRDQLENFIKKKEFQNGYQRVSSPQIARSSLYECSGHLKFYKDDMYPPILMENQEFYLRPMNCPHHHLIYKSKLRSYKELPLRLAEYGQVYRNEASGALRGLSRVRGLCQNDGHIYVASDLVKNEILKVLDLHLNCYLELGISGFRFRLSKHDPDSSEFEGDKAEWVRCENILRECLIEKNLDFFEEVGEAAFYGPKIDIQIKFFSEGNPKEESMSSIQLDFLSPKKINLSYVNKEGNKEQPYIIHRAPLGSHERFIAMLLEYFDGHLPRLINPIELMIYPMSEEARAKACELKNHLMGQLVRVHIDERIGSSLSKRLVLGRKLRAYSYLVIGEKELKSGVGLVEKRNGQASINLLNISSIDDCILD